MSSLRVKHRQLRNTWGGSVITCTAIGKLMQRGRIGLGLPLHVRGDISETDVCFTNEYAVHVAQMNGQHRSFICSL